MAPKVLRAQTATVNLQEVDSVFAELEEAAADIKQFDEALAAGKNNFTQYHSTLMHPHTRCVDM